MLTFLVFTAVIVIFGFSIDFKIPIDTYQLSFTCQWRRSGVIRVNIQQISHIVLVFYITDFEVVNAGWVYIYNEYYRDQILKGPAFNY